MNSVEEIKFAVTQLPTEQLASFRQSSWRSSDNGFWKKRRMTGTGRSNRISKQENLIFLFMKHCMNISQGKHDRCEASYDIPILGKLSETP